MIKTHLRFFLLVLAISIGPASSISAQQYPNFKTTYVNDFENLLSRDTEDRVTQILASAKTDHDLEVTLVTIEQMSDYPGTARTIEGFATDLFNFWGVGNADRNDGILILVSELDRQMRIALGSGYSKEYDARMQYVIDEFFIPNFKNGNYEAGIENGVKAILVEVIEPEDDGFDIRRGWNPIDWFKNEVPEWIKVVLAFLGFGGGVQVYRRYRRNRPRICPECENRMHRLDELSDDAFLDPGQRIEEAIKSKDYDVWQCGRDGHTIIEGYKGWFSSYKVCPQCGYRTMHTKRTVIYAASTSTTGKARLDHSCENCDFTDTETVVIPKKSKSSSSSGSSFGGGSSSGGGASGSW